jgi:hypothetical protein
MRVGEYRRPVIRGEHGAAPTEPDRHTTHERAAGEERAATEPTREEATAETEPEAGPESESRAKPESETERRIAPR